MKTFAKVLSSLAACAPLVCVPVTSWAQDDTVASVGSAAVTQSDMATLLKSLDPDMRVRLAADPARLDQLVRARLAQAVVLNEAKAKGWDKQPEVKRMVEQSQREVVARSYLASVSAPAADYPSDSDMQAAYDQNKAAFTLPDSLHFAQIFIAVPQDADKTTVELARKQASDLAKQAHVSGADFGAIAKANSQDKVSAQNGGDMGFMPNNMLMPEVRKVAGDMNPGDVSQPIQTAAGFHVIKLVEKRAASVRPYAQVKDLIRASLRQQRTQQNVQAYLSKAVGPSTVAINEDILKKSLSAAQ